MVFGHIISPPRGNLSLQQSLELANVYLENAGKVQDVDVALVLCHDTEMSLSHAKKTAKRTKNTTVHKEIASAYTELGRVLVGRGYATEAQGIYKKAEKLEEGSGHRAQSSESKGIETLGSATLPTADIVNASTTTAPEQTAPSTLENKRKQGPRNVVATISQHIFADKVSPPTVISKLPQPDERLNSTPQLACCLSLLRASYSLDEVLEPVARDWLHTISKDDDEDERLKMLAVDVIRAYKRDELKDAKVVAEAVCLAPVLDKQIFRELLDDFYTGIGRAGMLKFQLLDGLAQMVQGADPSYLEADDLVRILQLISDRLRDTHGQSRNHIYQLTLAASRVLDAMADTKVSGLSREDLHLPLSTYLNALKKDADPCMVFQAAYAYQALICVPDDESLWKATMRRTGKIIKGVSGLVSAVKGLDLNGFIEGLASIQQGFEGVSDVLDVVRTAYGDVSSLAKGGKNFIDCLKEGLSFSQKCAWYSALRGADELIRQGEFVTFKKLVCEAPCRLDLPFQWGVCQRLGEIAANPGWDVYTRRNAISFLGEIYVKDEDWGHQESIKQWILDILLMLSSSSENPLPFAETLLQELGKNGGPKVKEYIEAFREKNPGSYPLKIAFPPAESSTLLDRVQNKPDVEGILRQLKRHRQKERGESVFIQPLAKASLKASDDDRFDLMTKVRDFMGSEHKVFLLLGDSGSGKSTFNLQLECDMWQEYKKGTGVIPLHINLPAIEKPEQDMIAKQLRKLEFTEPEIRELKNRDFMLICDGYDESQQTHNLYVSNRLNQTGEWKAKMVITCRSEYVGVDYQYRFQPGDRNNRTSLEQLQEAVMTPFTVEQIDRYVDEYVKVHQPLWEAKQYKTVLANIPSLMELVKNPFLMTLSLEVLPRIVDPKQQLSSTRVTRVSLYDQFIVHWLERGKKRLSEEELSSQAKAAFQSLVDEGFTQNGVDFLKRLAVAIFKEQEGQPVVKYSRFKDEGTWKSAFFSREDEKQLLREACPLTRSGNQHRFVHRSLLEYGLALAIFDPQEWKERTMSVPVTGRRRGSTSSVFSFHVHGSTEATEDVVEVPMDEGPDPNSPLVGRYYVNEPSVIHFLAERAQQEPLFKKQLLDYIELSKMDKEKGKAWRIAAANAITILVKAGVQFNGADLEGIQIPGADLSYGMFDSAKLQGADLRQANLRSVWLRQADLTGARMTGVQFGEMPLLSQELPAFSCAYSPDGKLFAVGLYRGGIKVYTTSSWEQLWSSNEHISEVFGIAFSPDGKQIVSGSLDYDVRLWDVETGVCTRTLYGHESFVYSVAYSPEGGMVVSAGADNTIRHWDSETGECYQVLTGHADAVNSVAYSPNGDQFASGSKDKTVRLWDIMTGECSQILDGHENEVKHVEYSPLGDILASSSDDATVRLWDPETGACSRILTGHSYGVTSFAFSRQGDMIASGGADKTVKLWDIESGTCHQTFTGHSEPIYGVLFSPKGDCIATCSDDTTVRFWDIGTHTVASRQDSRDASVGIKMIKYLPESDQVLTYRWGGSVQLMDAETGVHHDAPRDRTEEIFNVAYSKNGDMAVGTTSDRTNMRLWNINTGECRDIPTGHTLGLHGIQYSPQGNQIATGSRDTTIKLWNVETGICTHTLTGHTGSIRNVVYSPDGGQVASGGDDKTVRLWDTETGEGSHVLQGHRGWVDAIEYSPDGSQLASSSADNTVRLWDVETGACIHTLTGHEEAVIRTNYLLNGDAIVSLSLDCSLRLWDTESGACLQVLTGHTNNINYMVLSPDESLVATGGMDMTVRVWDVVSGECRAMISGFSGDISGLAWRTTPEGDDYLISGCCDGSLRLWKVVVEGQDEESCHVQLCWSSSHEVLAVKDACIQGVLGLSQVNTELLKQRGSVGEPTVLAREATKKILNMATVLTRFKQRQQE